MNNTIFMQNRELSWLKFNERVLNKAEKEYMPLFEKLNFISIFTSNLDEFFMIRVGSLGDLAEEDTEKKDNKTGMSIKEQIEAIMQELPSLYEKKDMLYNNVMEELKDYGIHHLDMENLEAADKEFIDRYFDNIIFPVLSPQIINKVHPFPFLGNKKKHIFLEIVDEKKNKDKVKDKDNFFALIPIGNELPDVVFIPHAEKVKFLLIEDILLHYAEKVFPNLKVKDKYILSVTRNFDFVDKQEIREEFDDYKLYMKEIIKKRRRLKVVRVETNKPISKHFQELLMKTFKINKDRFFSFESPMDMSFVSKLKDVIHEDTLGKITYKKFIPYGPYPQETTKSYFSLVEDRDLFLSYPYDDMGVFLNLIKEASTRDDVVSIKISIYRLAKNSHLVQYLTSASEKGIEVTVYMELKARFDEENNINYSEILYNSGCTIIYGFEEYKIHSKICLITYRKDGEIRYITQIGTGNYNENTSKLYTDFSLMTTNREIGKDANDFFNNMSMGIANGSYKHLLQSPSTFKNEISNLMDEEIRKGKDGRLLFKMNSLTDKDLIEKISQASNAGVEVKMVIRGICCILPNVKGHTENVHVSSIVGRFLEHSRVYIFGRGDEMKVYISSADLMTRNTQKRIEVACPVYDMEIKAYIEKYLLDQLNDNVDAKYLDNTGFYNSFEKRETDLSMQEKYIQISEEKTMAQNSSMSRTHTPKSIGQRMDGKSRREDDSAQEKDTETIPQNSNRKKSLIDVILG